MCDSAVLPPDGSLGDCYRRSFRPAHVKVRPRRDSPVIDHERAVSSLLEASRKEPQKEMSESPGARQRIQQG